jgi:hypothetical protein
VDKGGGNVSDYSLWKKEEERREANKGLTGRGLASCVTVLISAGVAYLIYRWLSGQYDLAYVLSLPRDWPPIVVAALVIIVLFVAFQFVLTLLLSVLWRLGGKDKKVKDQLEEIYETWDQQ